MNSDTLETEKIRLLRKGEFKGSLYFEIAPGNYTGNHWHENSVYLSEEVFELLEAVFVKVIPSFGRYSFNEISRSNWELIINELNELREIFKNAAALSDVREKVWFSAKLERLFWVDFEECRNALLKLIADLTEWLNDQLKLKTHEKISVLGI